MFLEAPRFGSGNFGFGSTLIVGSSWSAGAWIDEGHEAGQSARGKTLDDDAGGSAPFHEEFRERD